MPATASASLAERAASLRIARVALDDLARRDPQRSYQHSSWASEWVCRHLHECLVCYWHAANSGGKSRSLGNLDVALLKGSESLGGVPIPVIPPPVYGALGTPSYKLGQAGSVIDIVRDAIGEWPHHEERVGGSVSVFHVKHRLDTSDDWHKWSALFVFPYEGPIPEGPRLDFFHADEPPPELWLSAALNRGKRGRRLYGYIGATPIEKRKWQPIRDQFPKSHMTIVDGRARLQSSVYDNRFLTPEDIIRQEQANPPGHPLSRAKLLGEHVDASGECPFDVQTLQLMLAECRDPVEALCRVSVEQITEEGKPNTIVKVPVEVFKRPEPGRTYYIDVDPASGVDDKKHNPAGIHCTEMGSGDLCVRWNGYLAPYSVGVLAAVIGRQYNTAAVDVEMKDHWGVNVIRGLQESHYGNLCYEERLLRPGVFAKEVGFDANEETRAVIIGAIQQWIDSWRAGVKYAACGSAKVIGSIMDCILDDRGKVVAAPGIDHGEDVVLRGRALSRCVRNSGRVIPELYAPPMSREQRLGRMIQGLDDPDDDDREPYSIPRAMDAPRVP